MTSMNQDPGFNNMNNNNTDQQHNTYTNQPYTQPPTMDFDTQSPPEQQAAPMAQPTQSEWMVAPVRSRESSSFKAQKRGVHPAAMIAACLCTAMLGGLVGGGIISSMREPSAAVAQLNPGTDLTGDAAEPTPSATTPEWKYTSFLNATEKSIPQIVEEIGASVVAIDIKSVSNSPFGQYETEGSGSGVIISEDGYILTNNHVVEGGASFMVTLRDGTQYEAQLIGRDSKTDLAIIKVEAAGLTPAPLGDSDNVLVGETAIVIGNPLGELNGTVTGGLISALEREITIDGKTYTLMQTDASINGGNSGGALVNGRGEVVGIVVAKSSGEGLGFAIPINTAKEIIDDLIDNGYVKGRPLMGVNMVTLTEQGAARYDQTKAGVYIYQVMQNSSAEIAGLQAWDRIVSIDGVDVEDSEQVNDIKNAHKVGDTLVLTIEREGEIIEVPLVLGEDTTDVSSVNNNGNLAA